MGLLGVYTLFCAVGAFFVMRSFGRDLDGFSLFFMWMMAMVVSLISAMLWTLVLAPGSWMSFIMVPAQSLPLMIGGTIGAVVGSKQRGED